MGWSGEKKWIYWLWKSTRSKLSRNLYYKMEHRVSNSQIEELLDHLAGHSSLAKGVGLGARSKETIDREWNDLAQKLNAHGSGANKSGQRWKRYWADIKHKAKSRAAARRRDASGTGGGPSREEDLSETDRKILGIIGDAAVYGDSQHRVPVFEIQNEPQTVNVIEDIIVPEDVVPVSTPESALATVVSPSKTGRTSTIIYTMHTPPGDKKSNVCEVKTATASPATSRPLKRSLFQDSKINKNSNKSNRTKVEPAWVVELESRRVAAEDKLANAAMIIAEASRTNAETARLNAECAKMHYELMAKLIETIKK
ncbi:uncharacterized protein LOC121736162 isoform X2 [Aricia agestis]|uniref:uncharacterized protein LOC121736162 isoform X2 n=1 Tax=Aricia agestis TaxID=91739 RepID=UPI001C2059A9|nr:uncharacterized protein LOC121736162 isoform X2 [Aricia agestis]